MTTINHGKYYAMKRVSKKHIVAKRQEEHMLFEKKILKAIQCDFIVRYQQSFNLLTVLYNAHRVWQCFPLSPFLPDFMQLSKTHGTSTWSWSSAVAGRSGPSSKKCEKKAMNGCPYLDVFLFLLVLAEYYGVLFQRWNYFMAWGWFIWGLLQDMW